MNKVSLTEALVPYSLGVNLQRIVTTVGMNTNLYLVGQLPINIPIMNTLVNNQNVTVSGQSFNVSLGMMINKNSTNDNTLLPVVIQNNDYIAFSAQLQVKPALTPQNLTQFVSLNIPTNMSIN
jgi:hypothetical protein